MRRLGILDLGSNTARLVVYNIERGNWFRLVDQMRERVRLGEGLGSSGRLLPSAMDRTEAAVALFAEYARNSELDQLEALATSAARDAVNGEEFLRRIEPYGLDLRVLEGEDEARTGVRAVANSFDLRDAWVVDLGGGSAQVSRMKARRFAFGGAYPLGAVRLTEAYFHSDPPAIEEVEALEQKIDQVLEESLGLMRGDEASIVAMGGTVRNLARAVQKLERYPLADRIHGYFLRRDALEALTDRLLSTPLIERQALPGIRADRADIVIAGALVFRRLMRRSGRDGLWISGYGLREGELFRHFLEPPHLLADLRAFSVRNLLAHYVGSDRRTETVKRLASRLFSGLSTVHGLGDREAELLRAAAELQDIGWAVNYYRRDQHSAHLVASAPLNGFSHREQALLSCVVRFYRKGEPSLGSLAACCRQEDARLLSLLVGCLRVASHLDRTRSGRVRDVRVVCAEREIKVAIEAGSDPSLELRGLDQEAALLASSLGRRLEFSVAGGSA